MTDDVKNSADNKALSRIDEFINAIESKTADKTHRRLINACRKSDPATAVETELKLIIEEIFREN